MKQKLLAISLVVLFCCCIIRAKSLTGLYESSNGYTVDFEVPEYQIEVVDTLGLINRPGYAAETYARIRVPDYRFIDHVGKPELPVFVFYMAITNLNQVPTFEVLQPVEESLSLKDRYFPRQAQWLKSQSILDRTFSINEGYYRSIGERQVLASVDEVFTTRGVPCIRVKISPFSYNPIENEVTVVKKFTLKINTATTPKYSALDSRVFERYLRYILVNFDNVVEPVSNNGRNEDYHIITGPSYESGLSEFVSFRQSRFNVTMVTTSQSGTSSSAIQSYIKGINPTPTFLLLVGDVSDIPVSGSRGSTDLYYSSTTGDYRPEILLGRFSVTSSAELSNVISKTIFMETKLQTIAKKNVFTGGADAGSGDIAEGTHNYVINTYLDDAGYDNLKLYCNSSSVSESQFTSAINDGVIFNFYSGHGSNTSWGAGDFSFSGSDAKNLDNTTSYPFSYGFACYTGSYSSSECFTEAAIRAENGAVTCVGASISTGWGQDDDMERGLFDGLFDPDDPQTTVSASLNAGKEKCGSQSYWEAYNLMGDPALEMFPINLEPFISVSSPNGGEEWEQGTTQLVRWSDNIDGNVKIDLFKGGSLKETLAASTESDGEFEWQIAGDYQTGTDYRVKITSVDSTALNDESDENFSIISEYIVECPYFQNFDTLETEKTILPKKWEQLTGDDLEWTVWTGKTPSKEPDQGAATGPDGDHATGSGNYVYVESSSPNNPDKKADYVTCKFNFKSLTDPKLIFWCHMFSDNSGQDEMGDLYLDICVDGNWNNDVVHLTGNHGDAWFEQTVDLNPYKGDRVIFRFRAITGSGWASDICIDDFEIDGTIPVVITKSKYPTSFGLQFYGSRIHYQVPQNIEKNRIAISLYSLQGRLVKTLVNDNSSTGYYSVPLPRLAMGLYLCRMEAGSFTKTIHLLLRK